MSAETKTRVLITGGYLDTQTYLKGSYLEMMTELLYCEEFLEKYSPSLTRGRFEPRGEIYADLAASEDDGPEEGPLLARWQAVVEIRSGEKAITSLTVRGPDGAELQ